MCVILEGAGFLIGGVVLAEVFAATGLGVTAGVEMVETEEDTDDGTVGFPAVETVIAGAELLTSTGSVDGIGFPSLV